MSDTTPAASLLRQLRRDRERSLREAAKDLGVAPSQLSRVERGQRPLGADLGVRVAEYYGISSEVVQLSEGRVPVDVAQILQRHPEMLNRIRSWATEMRVVGEQDGEYELMGNDPDGAQSGSL